VSPWGLTREALVSARSQPVSSAVTALIVAAVCAVILTTTTQTVQAERRVLSEIDAAGTRSIRIEDPAGEGAIPVESIDRIRRLSGVDWVIGLGPANDVQLASVDARPVAAMSLFGQLPEIVTTAGHSLTVGTAWAGTGAMQTFGLESPAAGVRSDGKAYSITGAFHALRPLDDLNRSLLVGSGSDDEFVRTIRIQVRDPRQATDVAVAAMSLLDARDPSKIVVNTAESLNAIREAVQSRLGDFGRRLILVVISVGLLLTAINVWGTVSNRRRDFGRRRALGASRSTIVALVTLQTAASGVVGVTVGLAGPMIFDIVTNQLEPDWPFAAAVGLLALLAAALAAVVPAVVAAYRDPITVLRIP
jgi:putative ABC transport system permease protein